MPEPTTEAGQRLLDHEMGDRQIAENDLYLTEGEVREFILAIEDEARADLAARLIAAVNAMEPEDPDWYDTNRAAVLAAIRKEAEGE